jgi:hypothetical protein
MAPGSSQENIRGVTAMVFFDSKEDGSPIIMNACLGPGNLVQPSVDEG